MCPHQPDSYKQILEILSALLTPAIAVLGAIILILQYCLSRLKWKLDLYDKRYPYYRSALEYIEYVCVYDDIDDKVISEFKNSSKYHDLLFGDEITTYLDLLYKQGIQFQIQIKRANKLTKNVERNNAITKKEEIGDWFSKQPKEARILFGKYLRIKNK